jgi:hypothetical protein
MHRPLKKEHVYQIDIWNEFDNEGKSFWVGAAGYPQPDGVMSLIGHHYENRSLRRLVIELSSVIWRETCRSEWPSDLDSDAARELDGQLPLPMNDDQSGPVTPDLQTLIEENHPDWLEPGYHVQRDTI